MMDEGQGLGQGLETSEPVANNQAPSAPVPDSAPVERVFKQSELNEIVKRVKHNAVEDYKRLSSEQPQYAQQKYNESPKTQSDLTSSEETIRRLAAEEAHRLRNEWIADAQSRSEQDAAQKIVSNFWNKVSAAKESYEDFDTVTNDIEYANFPNVVQILAEHLDNSGDVLYELGRDRFKMAQLEMLAEKSPKDALVQARRLAESIKTNKSSGNRQSREPLSQMRSSQTSTDSGVLTASDYRRLHLERARQR
jgi:hypothetical protein